MAFAAALEELSNLLMLVFHTLFIALSFDGVRSTLQCYITKLCTVPDAFQKPSGAVNTVISQSLSFPLTS